MSASAVVVALLVMSPAEDFLHARLTPCGFGGKAVAPEDIYEPELAELARRVDELAPRTHPEFLDHDIRGCGVAPERPVNSIRTLATRAGRTTVIADTGTTAMNNRAKQKYVLVETPRGWRVYDAVFEKTTLRAALTKRLAELRAVESERSAAVALVRTLTSAPTVKAGLNQRHRTHVVATLADGAKRGFIIESTAQGPQVWDVFTDGDSERFSSARKSLLEEAQALTDAEAIAFVRAELREFIKPTRGHSAPIASPLLVLMSIDAQLTDGVPYINGDIVCGCQDWENFSIASVRADGVEGEDGRLVRVKAGFNVFPDSPRHRTFVVVKTARGPHIYDVIDGEGSLLAILSRVVAEESCAERE